MSRTLMIALAGVAAAVLLAVFVIVPLLFSGDDDEQADPAAQAGQAVDAGADVAGDPAEDADGEDADAGDPDAEDPGSDTGPVDETFEVFSARDPFQQLVSDEQAAATVDGADSGQAAAEDGAEDTGEDAVIDFDGDQDSAEDDLDPPEDASVGGTTVSLVEVFEDDDGAQAVQVLVNGTGYEAAAEQDFAKRFRVLEIDASCATFLFGDQRFTLCEGESIRK